MDGLTSVILTTFRNTIFNICFEFSWHLLWWRDREASSFPQSPGAEYTLGPSRGLPISRPACWDGVRSHGDSACAERLPPRTLGCRYEIAQHVNLMDTWIITCKLMDFDYVREYISSKSMVFH